MRRPPALLLFVLGFSAWWFQYFTGASGSAFGKGFEGIAVAKSIANKGAFADPFEYPTGPSAHLAPLYPFIIALAIKLFGFTPSIVLPLCAFNAVLLGLLLELVYKIAGGVTGEIAALLVLSATSAQAQWETVLSAVLFATAVWRILEDKPLSAGLWSGLSVLSNPLCLPLLFVFGFRSSARFVARAVPVAILIVSPWLIRNWVVLGAPFFVRDNLGIELYIANNDDATAESTTNPALFGRHPMYNRAEAELVARMGERSYNSLRLSDALSWIRQHPVRFAKLSAQRFFFYWFPPPHEGWQAYGSCAITLLAMGGLYHGRANPWMWTLATAAMLHSLVYAFFQADIRYRTPALWIAAIPAARFVEHILDKMGLRPERGSGPIENGPIQNGPVESSSPRDYPAQRYQANGAQ